MRIWLAPLFNHNGKNDIGPPNLAEFVLIEYPAVVKNPEKALETLGGIDAISKAHFSSGSLELRFQPENPFDSALIADRRSQSVVFSGQLNLVLRCRRRKKPLLINVADQCAADELGTSSRRKGRGRKKTTTATNGEQQEAEEEPMEIICLGFVSTVYSFKTIYDFQLLPLSNKTVDLDGKKVHHDLLPHLVPCDFLTSIAWWNQPLPFQQKKKAAIEGGGGGDSGGQTSSLSEEAQSFLPPYQFSRYNNPSKFLLHDEVDHRVARRHPSTGHGKSLRTERRAFTICVNAKDPFPAAPTEEAIGDVDLRCKNTEHHRMLLDMFRERPLWSRVAIGYRTHIADALLKIILAKYAFYIQSGPWGRLWCRFGYDPRLEPEARKFQSVMVSFKRNQLIPERQRLRANTTATNPTTYGQFFDYIYRPKVLPDLRQMWYCICDVQLPAAQKICRRDYLDTLRECDPMTGGWLPGHRLTAIRRAIKEDVAQTSKRMGEGAEFLEEEDAEEEEAEDEEEEDFEEDEFLEMEEEEEESAFAAMEAELLGGGQQSALDIDIE